MYFIWKIPSWFFNKKRRHRLVRYHRLSWHLLSRDFSKKKYLRIQWHYLLKFVSEIVLTHGRWKSFGHTGSGHLCIDCFQIYRVFSYCNDPSTYQVLRRSNLNFLIYCNFLKFTKSRLSAKILNGCEIFFMD